MAKTIDGIIEAVRYAPSGEIAMVRAYERRGVVWSDHILLRREELVERLKKGQRYMTGRRKIYFGSAFEPGVPVRYVNGRIVAGEHNGTQDTLGDVPVF